jgi:alpha-galactosidase
MMQYSLILLAAFSLSVATIAQETSTVSERALILTPNPSPKPRITGTTVFGVRPGTPFLFTVTATGDRPMSFAADNLPTGLRLDARTGCITGSLTNSGEYDVTFHAKNKRSEAQRGFKILCGPQIGLTPAMGWNSWYCFGGLVTEEKMKQTADAMVSSGLINHGWTYINIDHYWQVNPVKTNDLTLQGPQRDAEGRILPNPRFPDMKGLVDDIHDKGLKAGIYSSPGPLTCGRCVGSLNYEVSDAQSYGDWGFDYLKYDWCTYRWIMKGKSLPAREKPYLIMRAALDKVPRDIIYSLCQYGVSNVWEWGAQVGGNSWRTTYDIRDTWESMSTIGFNQIDDQPFAEPAHFNDPDMLMVGYIGAAWSQPLRPTHLTPNEQYTQVSLWCLLSAPLFISCDLSKMDRFTLSLLSNDEVLDVDQDPLGRQARRVSKNGDREVWAKQMADGSHAVGLFNRDEMPAKAEVKWADLGLAGKHRVRDLWRQKDLGNHQDGFSAKVPRHGVVLIRVW